MYLPVAPEPFDPKRYPKKQLKRLGVEGTARFLTCSCFHKLPLFNNDKIKDRFVQHLGKVLLRQPHVRLISWVVMPDHVHLIVFPELPDAIPSFLKRLKHPFSRQVLNRWQKLNASVLPRLRDKSGEHHFWQSGGGYDRNVIGDELIEKICYMHKNPIERGLAKTTVEWKWSSARTYFNPDDLAGPPIAFDLVPDHRGDLI